MIRHKPDPYLSAVRKAAQERPCHQALYEFFYAKTSCVDVLGKFYIATEEIPAFKAAWQPNVPYATSNLIINLLIPKGATIYVGNINQLSGRKLRTNSAYVHSICEPNGNQLLSGISYHDRSFKYYPGRIVIPRNGFNMNDSSCSPGIHFFMDLYSALVYRA